MLVLNRTTAPKMKNRIAAGSAFVTLLAMGAQVNTLVVRHIAQPMAIHASLANPPRQAFDEIFSAPTKSSEQSQQEDPFDWNNAGRAPSINLNQWLAKHQGQPLAENLIHGPVSRLLISTMQISAQEALALLQKQEQERKQNQQWISQLPSSEQARIAEATNRGMDWSAPIEETPTWQQYAEKTVARLNSESENRESASGVKIQAPDGEWYAGSGSIIRNPVQFLPPPSAPTTPQQVALNGKIRMSPGLAMGDRGLEVHHLLDGIPMETGTVDPQSGQFSIQVADSRGELVAEMREKTGLPVASAHVQLTGLAVADNLELTLQQRTQLAAHFVDFNRNPMRLSSSINTSDRGVSTDVLVASLGVEQKSDQLGSFQFPNVSENSWALMRTQAPGFREALFLQPAGEATTLSLFSERILRALAQSTDGNSGGEGTGIFWGQILLDGKPQEGVTVTLEGFPDRQPTYLNGFVPAEAAATTSNGYFVFQGLATGFYQVTAHRADTLLGHLNLQVEDGAISSGNLEMTLRHQTVSLKMFDAFTGDPVPGRLELQSLPEAVSLPEGATAVDLPNLHRLSLGYAYPDSPNYVGGQILYSDDQSYVQAPLVHADWLQQLAGERRITMEPNTGVIIGFVPEDQFDAYLPHETGYADENKVYFDSQGRFSSVGVAGGGFIFYNVPAATESVVVVTQKTDLVYSQVMPVDVGSTTVLQVRF